MIMTMLVERRILLAKFVIGLITIELNGFEETAAVQVQQTHYLRARRSQTSNELSNTQVEPENDSGDVYAPSVSENNENVAVDFGEDEGKRDRLIGREENLDSNKASSNLEVKVPMELTGTVSSANDKRFVSASEKQRNFLHHSSPNLLQSDGAELVHQFNNAISDSTQRTYDARIAERESLQEIKNSMKARQELLQAGHILKPLWTKAKEQYMELVKRVRSNLYREWSEGPPGDGRTEVMKKILRSPFEDHAQSEQAEKKDQEDLQKKYADWSKHLIDKELRNAKKKLAELEREQIKNRAKRQPVPAAIALHDQYDEDLKQFSGEQKDKDLKPSSGDNDKKRIVEIQPTVDSI